MLTLKQKEDDPKVNFRPAVYLPEHEVGDEPKEGQEGDVHPPHPQQADSLHPRKFSDKKLLNLRVDDPPQPQQADCLHPGKFLQRHFNLGN